MQYTISYTKAAENDLRQITDYIALDDIDRAITYVGTIRKEVSLLADFPNIGIEPKYYVLSDKNCQVLIIDDYDAIYCIDEANKVIEIRRIVHASKMHGVVNV